MKIKLTSVFVDDQEKALRFYTDVLGFVKKSDFSHGPYRWLTVASAEEADGTELQLAVRLGQNNRRAAPYLDATGERIRQEAPVCTAAERTVPSTGAHASRS
jgi:catechol 2,3-dioxygenase-like lactoylglutathione lyase family enzyme